MDVNAVVPTNRSMSALAWAVVFFLAVDILLVVVTGLAATGASGRIVNQLNLGLENNAAVWWSSATLLLAALLFFDSAFRHPRHRTAIVAIAFLLAILSFDEMGSLHERIFTGSYWSYVPYGLAGGLLFLFAFWRLYRDESTRSISLLLFIGFSCFGSVVAQEFFEHNVDWPQWALGLRVGVEEGSELLGILLCLYAASRLLNYDKSSELIIPPHVKESQPFAFAIGIAFVVAGTYAAFRSATLEGYPVRGNPALWFAMAGFFLLGYEQLRGSGLLVGIRRNSTILTLTIVASLAQTMFVYQRLDISLLVWADLVLLAGFVMVFYNKKQYVTVFLFVALLPAALLAYVSFSGSATAAFLLSFYCATAMLGVWYLARRKSTLS